MIDNIVRIITAVLNPREVRELVRVLQEAVDGER